MDNDFQLHHPSRSTCCSTPLVTLKGPCWPDLPLTVLLPRGKQPLWHQKDSYHQHAVRDEGLGRIRAEKQKRIPAQLHQFID